MWSRFGPPEAPRALLSKRMSTHTPPTVLAFAMSIAVGFRLGMGDAAPNRLFWANDDVPVPDDDDER